jgi:FkbM family methyltransferase
MNLLMNMYRHHLIFGKQGISIFWNVKKGKTDCIKVPGVKAPMSLRSKTSDIPTFYEIFWKKEYDIALDFIPRIIIDAGSNVGLAGIFFANKYEGAEIISIEPEKSNFEIMGKNLSPYPNIKPIQRGLSNVSGQDIVIRNSVKGNWGFTTELADGSEPGASDYTVKTISINDIMAQNGYNHLDLVKIDIEGAEKEVFESGYEEWLPKTRCLIIELHDRKKHGCSKNLFTALSKYDFSFYHRGENLIFINKDFKA